MCVSMQHDLMLLLMLVVIENASICKCRVMFYTMKDSPQPHCSSVIHVSIYF